MNYCYIVGMKVNAIMPEEATSRVMDWARSKQSRYVCAANVHMTMECYDDKSFQQIVNSADMVTPDGMPLVWMLRKMGFKEQPRIYGPDLTLWVCQEAARHGIPVGFYGGSTSTLDGLIENLQYQFPSLKIVCSISPPYRNLTEAEDELYVNKINNSGVRILFVGLGCPKQEVWMAVHKSKIRAVLLGVGAAFDFHAGTVKQAPSWMQKAGLEWFFRLLMEPRRLFKRYFKHNPRFILLSLKQVISLKLGIGGSSK